MKIPAYLLLDVAGTLCALPREAVREIVPLPHLHMPPAAGGPLAGLLNFGGEPVPVVALAALLGLRGHAAGADPYSHVVLAPDAAPALLVDRALDLVEVEPGALRPAPEARSLNGCVAAEFEHRGRLAHLLAPDRVLTVEERLRLDALALRARDRLSALPPVEPAA